MMVKFPCQENKWSFCCCSNSQLIDYKTHLLPTVPQLPCVMFTITRRCHYRVSWQRLVFNGSVNVWMITKWKQTNFCQILPSLRQSKTFFKQNMIQQWFTNELITAKTAKYSLCICVFFFIITEELLEQF